MTLVSCTVRLLRVAGRGADVRGRARRGSDVIAGHRASHVAEAACTHTPEPPRALLSMTALKMAPVQTSAQFWHPEGTDAAAAPQSFPVEGVDPHLAFYRPEVLDTIAREIDAIGGELRALSLDIHQHPELKFEETHAHDVLTAFMGARGWAVERHYFLDTAWAATFVHGAGGRVLGVNSEMDALPGIGHACGHNLIAIAGVAVACGVKAAMLKHDIPGKVVLLGTPAEEGGAGKAILLEKGAYREMDACLMCHPSPGPKHGASLSSCLALIRLDVAYEGHTAHAAMRPWEAQNALDAAVSAYTNISYLRQQIKPTHRVHGVFKGEDWAANVIPDNAQMLWYIRAPTLAELQEVVPRVKACFEASALATGCKVAISTETHPLFDLRQNTALGKCEAFAEVFRSKFGPIDRVFGIDGASTDFGNVTYALPSLHPGFSIPTLPNGGNHTRQFAEAAATPEAHAAALSVSKSLALVGLRVLDDARFAREVRHRASCAVGSSLLTCLLGRWLRRCAGQGRVREGQEGEGGG
ncbi:hypothetical protein HETIRDRAFT_479883 [Heterobasidion irregulare TC 32-1]|uniref:Peptidase M20 dimerisation domain-containing protein n=1 Tax=Heterobasidion irregulare (strain TC 32-1) TaxID=747525 RepID=W4JUR2_HETIT|nr:uncharacterized protein HETIRDRAFT_479883 [Heterobasidion irregulare TC 32-1]ETW77278.1 hypothetical protein HETIRDRAFT_479883 [Heterobasidion irregulare TC 32-1]